MIKSKLITSAFQKFLEKRDIRAFRKSFFYYVLFRIVRVFLQNDIVLNIYNFRIYGSIYKNCTSYFLLKKCEFGDYDEMDTLSRFSNYNKIFLLDCGCNYGFYTFHVASLAEENYVISVEASKKTSFDFLRNKELNKLTNISFFNKAISDRDNIEVTFNESKNDWESSLTHKNFKSSTLKKVKTCQIDTLVSTFSLKDYFFFIKLDIEGNEINALKGGLKTIEKFSPIIIIEFSKFIFDEKKNIDYLNYFLKKFDYNIYDTNKKKIEVNEIIEKINNLTKRYKTIGNYYLVKNESKQLELFKKNE